MTPLATDLLELLRNDPRPAATLLADVNRLRRMNRECKESESPREPDLEAKAFNWLLRS